MNGDSFECFVSVTIGMFMYHPMAVRTADVDVMSSFQPGWQQG